MKEIDLLHGMFALVDDDDYEWLSQYKWYYAGKYAIRTKKKNSKTKTFYMHREIMRCKKGEEVDHANGNRLDNQRKNLRLCNQSQNSSNRDAKIGCTSKYKGVYWNKKALKWYARVCFGRKCVYFGSFDDEKEAASAYNEHAFLYYGTFARLNNVEEENNG